MIYEYQCLKCDTVQEKWHKLNTTNIDPCEKCGASADTLKRILSAIAKHGSWGRWSV